MLRGMTDRIPGRRRTPKKSKGDGTPKAVHDWLATAVGLLGLSLSLMNFWTERNTRAALEEKTVADILKETNNDLTALENGIPPAGRERLVKFNSVQTELTRALSLRPRSSQLRRMQAETLWVRGQSEQAIEYCQQAIKDIPDDSLLYGELGLIHQRSHHPQEALDAYHKAIEIGSDPLVVSLVYRNLLLLHVTGETTQQVVSVLRTKLASVGDHQAVCEALTHAFETYGDLFSDMQVDFEKHCRSKGEP